MSLLRPHAQHAPKRARFLGGRWLGAAFILFSLLAGLDQYWKTTPDAGFCPQEAVWRIASADWPTAWRRLDRVLRSDSGAALFSGPRAAVALEVRQAMGIRPTPLRFQGWLGRSVLIWGEAEGWCVCVRPGLLARVAYGGACLLGARPEEGIYRVSQGFYAWREGFLFFSPSRAVLTHALSAPRLSQASLQPPASIHFQLKAPYAVTGKLLPEPGLPFVLDLRTSLNASEKPALMPEAAPAGSLALLGVADGAAFRPLAARTVGRCAAWLDSPEMRAAWEQLLAVWQVTPESFLQVIPDQESLWIAGRVDASGALPVPEIGVVAVQPTAVWAGGLEAFSPVFPAVSPCAWQGVAGWRRPVLGNALSLCYATAAWGGCLTSSEPMMGRLMSAPLSYRRIEADLAVAFSWPRLAQLSYSLICRAALWELLPKRDGADVEARYRPYLEALLELGWFQCEGVVAGGGRLSCRGCLNLNAYRPGLERGGV